jgi:hypothetical protein
VKREIEVIEVGLQGPAGPPGEIDAEAAAVAVAEYLQQHGLTVSWGNLTGDIENQADLSNRLNTVDGGVF